MELVRPLLITGWVVGPRPIFLQLCWMPMTWNLDEPPGTSRVEKRTHCDGDTFGWKKRPKRGGWTFYVDKKDCWMMMDVEVTLLYVVLFLWNPENPCIYIRMVYMWIPTSYQSKSTIHLDIGNTMHASYGQWVKDVKMGSQMWTGWFWCFDRPWFCCIFIDPSRLGIKWPWRWT